jgi:CRP-like cAMP-binding protein
MSDTIFLNTDLNSLSTQTKSFLETCMLRKTISKGEQFLWEGDEVENVYFIIRGYAKIYHFSEEGREQILAVLKAGQFVNTVSALQLEQGNHANGMAMTEMELGVLDMADFMTAIRDYSDFGLLLLHDSADKLDHLTELVEELSLFSTRQRLIRFLLKTGREGQSIQGWTQEEIASQVGTVRDVVSRLLGFFTREGYIRVERQRIIVLDEERLQAALEE